jgi:hypothetical protein
MAAATSARSKAGETLRGSPRERCWPAGKFRAGARDGEARGGEGEGEAAAAGELGVSCGAGEADDSEPREDREEEVTEPEADAARYSVAHVRDVTESLVGVCDGADSQEEV